VKRTISSVLVFNIHVIWYTVDYHNITIVIVYPIYDVIP